MKERIVILGGGIAALTTAFELSSRPGWQERCSITVYPMGHRLGGKGASGRNAKKHDRTGSRSTGSTSSTASTTTPST